MSNEEIDKIEKKNPLEDEEEFTYPQNNYLLKLGIFFYLFCMFFPLLF
jgi:hypothetical protein